MKRDIGTDNQVVISGSNGVVEYVILYMYEYHLNMVIMIIYRPPACTFEEFKQIISRIQEERNALDDPVPTVVLNGYFNLSNIQWESLVVYGVSAYMRQQAKLLLDFADENLLVEKIT